MKQLIYNVFSLCTIFALGGALVSDKRFLRVIRLLFSLIFASVIFVSLGNMLMGDMTLDFPSFEGELPDEGLFDDIIKEASREGLVLALCEEFSLAREDISLVLNEKTEEEHTYGVSLVLSGKGVFADTRAIEEYLIEGGYRDVRITLSFDK